jgi:hypothetical protein
LPQILDLRDKNIYPLLSGASSSRNSGSRGGIPQGNVDGHSPPSGTNRERSAIPLNTILPEVKLRQFALAVKSLDTAFMQEMTPAKRYTITAALIELQNARALDDLTEMFIKRMMRTHRHAREALALDRLKHEARTDGLIRTLHEVILAWNGEGTEITVPIFVPTLLQNRS